MGIVVSLFRIANFAVCLAVLFAYLSKYRKLKRERTGLDSAYEAYEFFEHFLLCLWWFLGTILLFILEMNPFWILAWLPIGLAIQFLLRGIAHASGMTSFMAVGEAHLREVARDASR